MKPITKSILIVSTIAWTAFMLVLDFRNTVALNTQQQTIVSLTTKVTTMESNHVAILDSLLRWSADQNKFDEKLMEKVNEVNSISNKRIQGLQDFDSLLVQRLELISKAQSEVIKTLTGGNSTNAVDISR